MELDFFLAPPTQRLSIRRLPFAGLFPAECDPVFFYNLERKEFLLLSPGRSSGSFDSFFLLFLDVVPTALDHPTFFQLGNYSLPPFHIGFSRVLVVSLYASRISSFILQLVGLPSSHGGVILFP